MIRGILEQAVLTLDAELNYLSIINYSRLTLGVSLFQVLRSRPVVFTRAIGQETHLAANAGSIQVLVGSPIQTLGALKYLRESNLSIPSLTHIMLTGGQAGSDLLKYIKQEFPEIKVFIWYGSNEAGRLAAMEVTDSHTQNQVGYALKHVEMEILNESGELLPVDEVGIVRVRNPYMATEYHNDMIQSATSFRNGWFYSGDLGFMNSDGILCLAGRETEVINAGGKKILPGKIEEKVLSLSGIDECAGFEITALSGITEFALAVVGKENIDTVKLDRLLRSYFPHEHPTVFGQIEKLPVNANGKIDRLALRAEFEGRLGKDN